MANHVEGGQPAILRGESMPSPSYFIDNFVISEVHKRYGALVKATESRSFVFKEANGKFVECYREQKRSNCLFLNTAFISKENHTNGECFL